MNLKSQDILVTLKLTTLGGGGWSYPTLAQSLMLSVGETHNAIKRLSLSGLYNPARRKPIRAAVEEFLIHGVKYAFPAKRGGITRGVPTSWAAAPLKELLNQTNEHPPVWPHPEGEALGYEFAPLYATVPEVALQDGALYELLALLDAIRGDGARTRNLATGLLRERLKTSPSGDTTNAP